MEEIWWPVSQQTGVVQDFFQQSCGSSTFQWITDIMAWDEMICERWDQTVSTDRKALYETVWRIRDQSELVSPLQETSRSLASSICQWGSETSILVGIPVHHESPPGWLHIVSGGSWLHWYHIINIYQPSLSTRRAGSEDIYDLVFSFSYKIFQNLDQVFFSPDPVWSTFCLFLDPATSSSLQKRTDPATTRIKKTDPMSRANLGSIFSIANGALKLPNNCTQSNFLRCSNLVVDQLRSPNHDLE